MFNLLKPIIINLFFSACVLLSSSMAYGQLDSSYQLGVGDKVKVVVFEEPDMSFDFSVDSTGVFNYPYLGEITIKGKTTPEIERALIDGLKGRVLVNPNVAVSIIEYRPFSIGGEVKKPGDYAYQPNLTVQKAINLAGGVTEWSNGKRFDIEREKVIQDERLSLDSFVFPGDIVTILPRRF